MILRSLLLSAFVLLSSFIGGAPRALAAAVDPTSFVSDLASRALAPMPNEDTAVKQERFRQLFRQYFDVEACARAALGPYWLKATALQRQEFVGLYEDYVVIGYSTAFRALGGESFKMLGSQGEGHRNEPDRDQRRCADQGRLAAQPDQPWLQGDRRDRQRHQHGQRPALRLGLGHPA
jgi:ABC-type transporter MlaC component